MATKLPIYYTHLKSKVKYIVPYSITSVGRVADPDFLTVIPQVMYSHKANGRLPLLSTRPAVTSPAKAITPLADTKLYCLTTEARRCK